MHAKLWDLSPLLHQSLTKAVKAGIATTTWSHKITDGQRGQRAFPHLTDAP